MMNDENIYDLVIVGAGPVGLASAIALYQRGITNLLVIDQTTSFRRVGQVVDLLPNGLKALKSIDLSAYEAVKASSLTLKKTGQKAGLEWIYKNLAGEKIRSIPLDYDYWAAKYTEGRVTISWYDLQTALRTQLPEELVKDNHRCVNFTEDPEGGYVVLELDTSTAQNYNPFAHWSELEPISLEPSTPPDALKYIKAKLVIAADGINSTLRRVLYQGSTYEDYATPEYSGFAAILCQDITIIPQELIKELEAQIFQDTLAVTISGDRLEEPSLILFRRATDEIGYMIHTGVAFSSLEDKSGAELLELALKQLKAANFPQVLIDLVSLSPLENLKQRPYYIHRAAISNNIPLPSTASSTSANQEIEPMWSKGRVVLVGDAAHGMPPFMAQGTNQGFEDVVAIAKLIIELKQRNQIDNQEAITKAFESYQQNRRPFMIKIQQATLQRLTYRSDQEWLEYSDLIYGRNFQL